MRVHSPSVRRIQNPPLKTIRKYYLLRKHLLSLKGIKKNNKTQLSQIRVREAETRLLFKFYNVRFEALKTHFLSKPLVNPSDITADKLLIFLIFETRIRDLKDASSKEFQKLIRKNKLRRTFLKVRVIARLNLILRHKQMIQDLEMFGKKLEVFKKKLKERIYFREETMVLVIDGLIRFAGMKKKIGLVQYEHARIVRAVQKSKDSFLRWVDTLFKPSRKLKRCTHNSCTNRPK